MDAYNAALQTIQEDLDAGKIDQEQADFLRKWLDGTVVRCQEILLQRQHLVPWELTPSPGGKECLGNGHWPGYECQCPDCDYYETICFPDWEGHKEQG